jgi:outer membrane lipoprotein
VRTRRFLPALLAILLAACAQSPVAPEGVGVAAVGPAHVLAEEGHEGELVVWGGRIVAVENLAGHSELIVVSLPLDRADRPRINAEPGVRFMVIEQGFLEPMQFAPGRYVTVLGRVSGIEERAVGEYLYQHPSIEVERLHLWPADTSRWQSSPRFSIGVGIRL